MDWKAEVQKVHENRDAAFKPQWDDLEHLWNLVLERQPGTILEFGSGYSSLVMGLALKELGRGQLFALEGDPSWHASNSRDMQALIAPKEPYIHQSRGGGMFIFSPAETVSPLFCRYSYMPIPSADMLYVDGPALFGSQWLLRNLEELASFPFTIVVDEREWQVAHLEGLFYKLYDVEKEYKESGALARTTMTLKGSPPLRTN